MDASCQTQRKYSMGKWKHLGLEFAVHTKFEQIGTSYTASFSEDEQTIFQLTQFSSTMGLGTKVKLKMGNQQFFFFIICIRCQDMFCLY